MGNDPRKKVRVLTAVLSQPKREIVIGDDGYRPAVSRLQLQGDVTPSQLKNLLESLAFKDRENPLVRVCREGEKIFRQRPPARLP